MVLFQEVPVWVFSTSHLLEKKLFTFRAHEISLGGFLESCHPAKTRAVSSRPIFEGHHRVPRQRENPILVACAFFRCPRCPRHPDVAHLVPWPTCAQPVTRPPCSLPRYPWLAMQRRPPAARHFSVPLPRSCHEVCSSRGRSSVPASPDPAAASRPGR